MQRSHNSILLVEPCTVQHLESLLEGKDNFFKEFGITIANDYEIIPILLEFSLNKLMSKAVLPRWWTHLFILAQQRILVGIGGYKGNPSKEGMVEIGYSIADSYQNQGLGTEVAKILVDRAFRDQQIQLVRAHTLAHENASTSILKKVGMKRVGEAEDPRHGKVWQWEIQR